MASRSHSLHAGPVHAAHCQLTQLLQASGKGCVRAAHRASITVMGGSLPTAAWKSDRHAAKRRRPTWCTAQYLREGMHRMRKVSSSYTVATADTQRRAPPGAAILSSENAPARLTRNSHAEEVHLQGAQGQTGNERQRQKQGGLCRTSTSEASAKHKQQQHGRRYSTKRLLSSPGSRRCRVACSTWAAGCSACRAGSGRCLQQPGVAVHLKHSLNSNRPAATSCTLPHPQLPHRRSRSRAWHEYQAPKLMISHAPASSKGSRREPAAARHTAGSMAILPALRICWLLAATHRTG